MPKIIQIMQGDAGLTGLGDDGVTYTADISTNEWVEWIKPLPKTVKKRGEQFKAPSVIEVENYMIELRHEKNYSIIPVREAQSFHDYWESMGWKRNNKKMACWKASVRTWLNNARRDNENRKRPNQSAAERVAAANGLNSDFTPANQTGHIQPLAFDGQNVRTQVGVDLRGKG